MQNSKFWRLLVGYGLLLSPVQSKVIALHASDQCLATLADCASKEKVTCSTICEPITTATGNTDSDASLRQPSQAGVSQNARTIYTDHGSTKAASIDLKQFAENRGASDDQLDSTTDAGVRDLGGNQTEGLATSCSRVCVDNRIQNCIKSDICHEPMRVVERWEVTHYCLANDGIKGGWGFRLPLAVSLLPSSIEEIKFQSEIFPATEPTHITNAPKLNLTFAFSEDSPEHSADVILRKCDIESIPGDNIVANLKSSGKNDNSRLLSFKLGAEDLVANIAAKTVPIEGDKLIVSIVGSMEEIANGGLVPPPFDDTVFEVTHTFNAKKI